MTTDALADRLLDAHVRLEALRPTVEVGAPWAPSPNFGAEPEATWNPPELLAHVAEMLPYWLGQVERILEGYPKPVSFGRVQSDDDRIAAIGRDRALPVGDLYARIGRAVEDVAERLRSLSPEELEQRGTHPTLGEMTVKAVIERMVLNHLHEHADQLASIVEGSAGTR